MSESDGTLGALGALYAIGEAQRKAQTADFNARLKNNQANEELGESIEKISNLNDELEDDVARQRRHKNHLLREFAKEREYRNEVVDMYNNLLDEHEDLKAENEKYKQLLCKPMAEIAAVNENFKETYEKQMEIMAEWMVSQKAFKELAIQFGFEKGLTHKEVIDIGNQKKLDVLDNKNEEKHGTNSSDIPAIENRNKKLKEKILNNSKK